MSTGCWKGSLSVTKLTREVDRLGSTAARLKLKGIDGDPHKRWMMWFNSMQREKPYLPLTCLEFRRDVEVLEREPEHRCCMAVVSSCREMLGYVPQRAQPLSLVATKGHSNETAGDKPEEGGDDVRSSWPLWVGLHTSYNGRYRGLPTREGELIPENRS